MRQATPTYELLRAAFADADGDLPRYRVLYQAIRESIGPAATLPNPENTALVR